MDGARERAAAGELCFSTVDSLYLALTGGMHVTDATNANRTSSITSMKTTGMNLPALMCRGSGLPRVMDCAGVGSVGELFDVELPIEVLQVTSKPLLLARVVLRQAR